MYALQGKDEKGERGEQSEQAPVEDITEPVDKDSTENQSTLVDQAADEGKKVQQWLEGLKLAQYFEQLSAAGYKDMESLTTLAPESLGELGITLVGHRRKLAVALSKLTSA